MGWSFSPRCFRIGQTVICSCLDCQRSSGMTFISGSVGRERRPQRSSAHPPTVPSSAAQRNRRIAPPSSKSRTLQPGASPNAVCPCYGRDPPRGQPPPSARPFIIEPAWRMTASRSNPISARASSIRRKVPPSSFRGGTSLCSCSVCKNNERPCANHLHSAPCQHRPPFRQTGRSSRLGILRRFCQRPPHSHHWLKTEITEVSRGQSHNHLKSFPRKLEP